MSGAAFENAILGCAFGYSSEYIRPFLNSLQQCGYKGDLILLTNNQSGIGLEGYGFNGIIRNIDEALNTTAADATSQHNEQALLNEALVLLEKGAVLTQQMLSFFYREYFLMTSRYFLCYNYLLQHNYTNVFLTDVSDVVFQHNPFAQPFEDGVTAFAEHGGVTIKDEPTNRYWIRETFGDAMLQQIGDEVVYCAGTTMLQNCAVRFLKDFLNIVIRHKVSRTIQGVDQGVYNYMLHHLKPGYFHYKQNGDVVLTVANVPEDLIAITDAGITLNGLKQLPAVVHQYTRFAQQKAYVLKKFGTR